MRVTMNNIFLIGFILLVVLFGYTVTGEKVWVIPATDANTDFSTVDVNNAAMLTMPSAGNVFQLKADEIGGVNLTETVTGNILWYVSNSFFQPLNIKLSDILGTAFGSPLLIVNDNGYLDKFSETGIIKTSTVENEYTAMIAVPNTDYLAPNLDSNQRDINARTVFADSMYVDTWNGYSDTNFIKKNGGTFSGTYNFTGSLSGATITGSDWTFTNSIFVNQLEQLGFGNIANMALFVLAVPGYYPMTTEPTFYINATGTPIEILTAATKYFMIRNNNGTPLFKIENDTGNLYTKNDVNVGRDLNAARTIDANQIRITGQSPNNIALKVLNGSYPAITASGTNGIIYVSPNNNTNILTGGTPYAGYFRSTATEYGFMYNDNATMALGAGTAAPIIRASYNDQIPGAGDNNTYYPVMIGLADTNYSAVHRGGRYLLIADKNELKQPAFNFGHGFQANPTIFIHSSYPTKNEWGSLAHNWNSFDINSGNGPVRITTDLNIQQKTSIRTDGNLNMTSPNGQTWNCGVTNTGEFQCT